MAQNLREYQRDILARLQTVKDSGTEAAGYLGVMIGNKHVLVNLQEISETLPISEVQSIPLVKPWFLGLSNVRGVLYAVNDLAQMLDSVPTAISSSTRMLLLSDSVASNVAFLVDKLIGLRKLDEMKLLKELQEEDVCMKPQIYEDAEKRNWYVLDCDKLMRSRELAIPYLV